MVRKKLNKFIVLIDIYISDSPQFAKVGRKTCDFQSKSITQLEPTMRKLCRIKYQFWTQFECVKITNYKFKQKCNLLFINNWTFLNLLDNSNVI